MEGVGAHPISVIPDILNRGSRVFVFVVAVRFRRDGTGAVPYRSLAPVPGLSPGQTLSLVGERVWMFAHTRREPLMQTLSGYAPLTRSTGLSHADTWRFLLKHVLAHGKVTTSWSLIP